MSDRTTTRARAWALTRRDGLVLGFTDHDRDLVFDGITFRAGAGMTASALVQAAGLATDNTEAAGALSDAGLTEADILAGRYDGAELVIHEVDWTDTAARRILFRGTLGEITRAGGAFRAELRGLSEPLSIGGGRVFGTLCPAVLGDARCGFDLGQAGFSVEAALTAVSGGGARLDLPEMPEFAADWFVDGSVRFLTGAAEGLVAMVRREEPLGALRRLHLWAAPGAMPVAGDRVRLVAGCDKRLETCRYKFSNVLNFQGFPHVPADDWLMATPSASDENAGGSLTNG
ncbi:MAG: DUF2163 domain-containing protein [Pararhodobacter sp.]